MLKKGNKVGIVCCSNGLLPSDDGQVRELMDRLQVIGLVPICSNYIFQKNSVFNGSGRERADALTRFYLNDEIKAIFDISGGDLANDVLGYLDFDLIKRNRKPFFGYSDLTTIINAIYARTGCESYLYQAKNLIHEDKETQISDFIHSVIWDKNDLYKFKYRMIQGSKMEGIVVGGNIRCLLKLSGTPFIPSFKGKILFLESLAGEVALMTAYLNQLKQMSVFEEISGLLLGTFTALQAHQCKPSIEELVAYVTENKKLPVAKTEDIGHGHDSKCLIIGKNYIF